MPDEPQAFYDKKQPVEDESVFRPAPEKRVHLADPYRGQRIGHHLLSVFYVAFLVAVLILAISFSRRLGTPRESAPEGEAAPSQAPPAMEPGASIAPAPVPERQVPPDDGAGAGAGAEPAAASAAGSGDRPAGSGDRPFDPDILRQAANYHAQGMRLLRQGKTADAMAAFETALGIWPDIPEAYRQIGLIHAQNEDYRKAIAMFEQAVRRNPAAVELYNNLGFCHMQLNQLDGAEGYFKAAVDIDPNYTKARLNLGLLYVAQRRLAEGREQLEICVSQEPASLDARNNLAFVLTRLGDDDGAIEQLKEVLRVNPREIGRAHV